MSSRFAQRWLISFFFIVGVCAVGAPQAAWAIGTDRPDAAESSETVGAMRFQIETSVDFEKDERDDVETVSMRVPTKLRFGLLDALEIHLESDTYARDERTLAGVSASDQGMSDLDFGVKAHVLDEAGFIPSMGVLLSITAPVGSEKFTDDAWLMTPTLAADWSLPFDIGFGLNLGFMAPLTDRDRLDDTFRYAVALGRTLTPFTDQLRVFVEVFGEKSFEEGGNLVYMGGGLTWTPLDWLQLDGYVRGGLSDDAGDIGGGAGVSLLI